jgi:hypothetical protein
MRNLDIEQDRYYNKGLQGAEFTPEVRKFLTDYYKGVGKIADDFIVQGNPMSNDPFGITSMLFNAGTTNNASGKPVVTQTVNSQQPNPNAVSAGPNPIAAARGPVPSWFKPWTQSKTKKGRTSPTGQPTVFNPKDPNKFYVDYDYWKSLNNGKDFTGPKQFQEFIYDYISQHDPAAIDKMWDKWGTTNLGRTIPKNQRTKKAFADLFFGARTAELASWKKQVPTTTTTLAPVPGTTTTTTISVIPGTTTTTTIGVNVTTTTTTIGYPDQEYAWTDQDVRDLLNAGWDYATLKKYHPYRATVQPVLPEFIPTDWRGYAASLQSQQNKAADQLGTYQPGQGMAANLSFLQGQTGNALADYISKVDQYNASGATNMDAQRANILNQFTMYNAENRNKNWDDENVYDDRYRTAERLGRKGIVKAWNQGQDNATKIYNLNQVESPYYTVDPRKQTIRFNSDNARAAWEAATRGGASGDADDILFQRIQKAKNDPAFAGYTDAKEQMDAILRALGVSTSTPRNKTVTTPAGPNNQGKVVTTTYDDENTTRKFGGGVGASFVKSVSQLYDKLGYIADPNERQRLAEAYASKMHFGR